MRSVSMRGRHPARFLFFTALAGGALGACGAPPPDAVRHNVILFVADGLRPATVNESDLPTLSALQQAGVAFVNSHSLFPTVTMTNAASLATGSGVGTTGIYGNYL